MRGVSHPECPGDVPIPQIVRVRPEGFGEDAEVERQLSLLQGLPGVRKIVALGDAHRTPEETPNSIAVLTDDLVYPQFTSSVLNCGMTLIKTNLCLKETTDAFFCAFAATMRSASLSRSYPISMRFVLDMFASGAQAVVAKYGLPPSSLDPIENRGSVSSRNYIDISPDVREIIPQLLLFRAGWGSLAPSFQSNHFLEFQTVRQIVEPGTARAWGLKPGMLLILIHTDFPTSRLNYHYVPRMIMRGLSPEKKMLFQASKIQLHFLSRGSRKCWDERRRFYFKKRLFTAIPVRSGEGRRYLGAVNAATNLAYALRFVFFLNVRDVLRELKPGTESEVLWDAAHDSIQFEDLLGGWVARRGAVRSTPGRPAVIAGSYNVDSLLAIAQESEGARNLLFSYDHGCSSLIERGTPPGLPPKRYDHTLMLKPGGTVEGRKRHLDPFAIEHLSACLEERQVLKPVAWLQPVASIKETKQPGYKTAGN